MRMKAATLLTCLGCSSTLAAGAGEGQKEPEGPNMEPRIETVDLKLVGFQRIMVLDDKTDFTAGMKELRVKLFARLDDIPDISNPGRLVGRWQFVHGKTRVYFCAVQVDSLERFRPDHAAGLVGWDGGTQAFATWRRPNDQMGAVAYDAGPDYSFDGRFISDFETFPLADMRDNADVVGPGGTKPETGWHEFWLPAAPKREEHAAEDGGEPGDDPPTTARPGTPRIETIDLKLAGVQAVMVLGKDDIVAKMKELHERLLGGLGAIQHIHEPRREIGYWQFIDQATRVYFMGIQLDSTEGNRWDMDRGLCIWEPGPTTFAMWEEKNSDMGSISRSGTCWKWLDSSGYDYNAWFNGEFEAFALDQVDERAELPEDGTHEFWLPVVPKPRRGGGFETARLAVRRFTGGDWKGLLQLAQDKESADGAIYDHPWSTSEEGSRGMAEWCAGQERCFAVCLKEDGVLIGFVRISDGDEEGEVELGHMFHTEYRGGGYATEAIRRVVGSAFADKGTTAVIARNAVEWEGQLTPLEDLGFREISREAASFAKDAQGRPIEFTANTMVLRREDRLHRGGRRKQ